MTSPMGLSLEHAPGTGTRGSEKMEWWSSSVPYEFCINKRKGYFVNNDLNDPKPH